MNIKYKKIISAAAIIAAAALLLSCSRVIKMNYNDDGLLCGGDAEYRFAPLGYEPTFQGEEYALIDNAMQETLYVIGECDPKEWLTTEYAGAATMVYYSSSITLPTLSEMKPEKLYFCSQDMSVNALAVLGGTDEDDKIIADIIAMLYDESIEDEIWPRGDISETYQLKFYSSDWPAIYYNVVYAVGDGKSYFYDRVQDRCILAGDILDELYN